MDAPGPSSHSAGESFSNTLRDVGDWFSGLGEALGLPARRSGAGFGSASRLGGGSNGGSNTRYDGSPRRMPQMNLPLPSTSILSGKQQARLGATRGGVGSGLLLLLPSLPLAISVRAGPLPGTAWWVALLNALKQTCRLWRACCSST